MNFFEIVLTLAISLGAVVWGVNIYNQKGTWFLAGWNTMSKEEKATYNEKAICHLFGKCVVFCGIGTFLLLCGSFNHNDFVLCVGLGIIAIMVILSIIIPNPDKPEKFILYISPLCYSKEKGGSIMLLTDKYADKIYGIITCYDRMIIQGYIPNWSHADAMTTYMKLNGIRIFDYPGFSQPLTEQVRQNAEKIAQENGIEIEFIRKLHAFRKDDRIQKIIAETGKTEGLVHIFSAMECCNTYKPWHDKTTGKTFLKFDQSKCLHYYFYFIDRELGLCYLRVPTWPPFRLQFYMNGHNLLAHKLDKKQIAYRMQDNAFLEISDIETAQKLSDRINPEGLHKVLDAFARRYSPVPESLGLGYTWTVQQIECATDIMFRKQEYLEPIYDEIIRTAVFTVKPDNIAIFLGQRITYNCTKEIGTNYNQRILGTRIKHHMGDVSIKMYDKFGCVLRIESTCNDISTFRVEREVQHRDGTSDIRKAPLKKSIYSLYQLFTILKSANYRYLEFISSFDDHSSGRKKLDDVSRSLKEKERSYRGFNFFDSRDLSVLEAISRGEYMTFGMQGKNIREHLPGVTPSAMTRIFKRLKVHGLIEKIPGTYKYLITSLGKEIIAAGLTIKNLILVPALTS